MSDEQEVIDTGLEAEVPATEEKPSFSLDDWQRAQEEKASHSGWKPFDDYVASGGDPAKWKTADAFNVYGELISTMRKREKEFDQRLQGVQQLSQAQLAAQRIELMEKRDQAIEDGNKAAVHALDKQIGSLNAPAQPIQSSTELEVWNQKNEWIYDDTPKANHAKAVFGRAVASGKHISEAIELVEAEVQKHFAPKQPAQKVTIPEAERGKGSAGFGKRSSALSMSDLTAEEAIAWKHMPHAWNNDQNKFLQSVADMRKGAKQ
jgi:hypothetical protein